MSLRQRLIGPCGTFAQPSDTMKLDIGGLVRRLVLFDTFILDSVRLLEVPDLVAAFGLQGVLQLLESGALQLRCSSVVVGQTGQATRTKARGGAALPLNSYQLSLLKAHDDDAYLSHCLQVAHRVPGLTWRNALRLKKTIASVVMRDSPQFGLEGVRQTERDLDGEPELRARIATASATMGTPVQPGELRLRVDRLAGSAFRIESNLAKIAGVTDLQAHRVVERALMAMGRLNLRIEEMKSYDALSGVLDDDASALDSRFGFVLRAGAPGELDRQFLRVAEIAGMPDVPHNAQVSASALLKLRESRECREFRHLIQRADDLTDAEIRERVTGLRASLQGVAHGLRAKAVRLAVTTGLGFAGGLPGFIASTLDTFLVERIFGEPGPAAFISRSYPSLFTDSSAPLPDTQT